MMYTLREIALPLLVAFIAGLGAGWFTWRWRRTPVAHDAWTSLQARAAEGDAAANSAGTGSPEQARRLADLAAAVEIRDIEIAELRKAIIESVDNEG